ncbi:MAG: gamma-glutamyl-gamma-aminobutyrate hydrolase family protein [Thioalkalivibrio sp.]|nr:gamma-glutamyl-gamma-aminobutyrate hydrolase family protein [Thioalkalivibrio sp.]
MTGSDPEAAREETDGARRRPLVAITGPDRGGWPAWFFTALAVRRAGGRPLRIRPSRPCYRCHFDALIVGGGADVDPALYDEPEGPSAGDIQAAERRWTQRLIGYAFYPMLWLLRRMLQSHGGALDPERDRLEKALINRALDEHLPMLGICRGMQLINVVLGGSLNRSLDAFYVETPKSRSLLPVKRISLESGSRLEEVFGPGALWVNALHDQAVKRLGRRIRVAACEPAGVIQAIESTSGWCIGVQWHPEYLPQKEIQQRLFRALVEAARQTPARSGQLAAG